MAVTRHILVALLLVTPALAFAQAPPNGNEAVVPTPTPAATPTPAPPSGTATYDGGFVISDAAGNNKIKINEMAQFRYYVNHRNDTLPNDPADSAGFEMTNSRITFAGNFINPQLTFNIEGEFGKDDGVYSTPFNYNIKYTMGRWAVKVGQFKLPLMQEEIISQKYQLSADSSIANEIFSQDYSQGVQLEYKSDRLFVQADVNDGIEKPNSIYTSPEEADFASTARVAYRIGGGDFKRYDDFSSSRGSPFGAMFGVAGHVETYGGTANFEVDSAGGLAGIPVEHEMLVEWTADAQFEGNGWNGFAAVTGAHSVVKGEDPVDDMGFVVQAGDLVTDHLEPFVRYDMVIPDADRPAEENKSFSTITAGANYYFVPKSHNAKLTVNVSYFLDDAAECAPVAELLEDNDVGLQAGGGKGQVVGVAQLQWLF